MGECGRWRRVNKGTDRIPMLLPLFPKIEQPGTTVRKMKVAVADRSAGFGDFISWMKSNGAEVDGVKIAHFSGYDYGLQAEKDFEEGELMIAVPRKLMMSADNAKDSVLGPLMRKDPMLQHMPNVALSLLLLAEKFNPDSFWRPYIKVLPTLYTTVLYFTTSELQELKGSPTLGWYHFADVSKDYLYKAEELSTFSCFDSP
uniref:protein-histidine N-methyltransferase n=1 Tax=Timema californicum TaxID=61474 RepID=A0A7R9J226_TIMCA|nr:unnamed protein product [Timema californicum]